MLLPRAAEGRDVLPAAMRAHGASVDIVPVYRTVAPTPDDAAFIREDVAARPPDVVVFTSGSTVRNLIDVMGGPETFRDTLGDPAAVCIGPATAESARSAGLRVTAVAHEHTEDGLVEALVQTYGGARRVAP
jgi:uroporphyrinogen III methyltransferase/synthase